MECPRCESKAIQYDYKKYRHAAGEPITEVRAYACTNLDCMHAFAYQNVHMGERKRVDVKQFLKTYERQKARQRGEEPADLFDQQEADHG